MSEGLFPPNPVADPDLQPPAAPRGVPVGGRDQVIVDIPRRYDPRYEPDSPDSLDDAEIDATLERSRGDTAAPFDQEAYDRAQEKARREVAGQEATSLDDVETVVDLTDAERADLNDFFSVGKRKGSVKVLGHTVHCQTLNALDEMNIGRYVKPYMDSPGFVRAWTVATAAAGIRLVDGKRIFDALAPIEDEAELFDEKVRLVARAFPYVITPVYDRINELDAEFAALAAKLSPPKTKPNEPGKVFG